jgi:hypothetical protein
MEDEEDEETKVLRQCFGYSMLWPEDEETKVLRQFIRKPVLKA